jgi:hypothetical protein
MNWVRLVAIVLGTAVLTSLTDWLFAGDWLHKRYTYPEVWRQGLEARAIALTSPLPFLTCGAFAPVVGWLSVHSVSTAVKLAVAMWLIGPLPLILPPAVSYVTLVESCDWNVDAVLRVEMGIPG